MGIALLAFSSLSHPVKALTQWFARPGRSAGPSASMARRHPPAGSGTDAQALVAPGGPEAGGVVPPASANAASMAGAGAPHTTATPACVVPMTRVPAATVAAGPAFHALRVQSVRTSLALPSAADRAANAASFHGDAELAAPGRRRPVLRVLRRIQVADPTRLVLSGRMADVCAELDRLAASEAALTA